MFLGVFRNNFLNLQILLSLNRLIEHSLSASGPSRRGFDALDMDLTGRGYAGKKLGRYEELCFLADKVARFLFEFHADEYQALLLPAIPSTASSGTIHKLLKTHHVCQYMLYLVVILKTANFH